MEQRLALRLSFEDRLMLQMMFVYGKEQAQNIGHRFHLPDIAFFRASSGFVAGSFPLLSLLRHRKPRFFGRFQSLEMQYKSAAIEFSNRDALTCLSFQPKVDEFRSTKSAKRSRSGS